MSATNHVDLAEQPDFRLGNLTVRPQESVVEHGAETHKLQPRVMQVLVALAQAAPRVVSRDKLIELCWDGRAISDDALNRCVLALRHLADEISPTPFAIETVPRVGHRLIVGTAQAKAPRRVFNPRQLAAAAVALAVAASAAVVLVPRTVDAAQPVSIAVLPFRNLAPGPGFFAEGLSEEITTRLTREKGFRVSGSNSTAGLRNPGDPHEVREKLGVDYLLEGSVRSDGGRVRVNAGLVRTLDGVRVWSDSYDGAITDVLAIQNTIGQALADQLRVELSPDAATAPAPRDPAAYAAYLQARGMLRSENPDTAGEAIPFLRQSIRLAPNYAPAWTSLAQAIQLSARVRGKEGFIAALPQAEAAARKALRLDPGQAEAHGLLGSLLDEDSLVGQAHLRRAAAIAPHTAQGWAWRGLVEKTAGRNREALAAYRKAHALDPGWGLPTRMEIDLLAMSGQRSAAEAVVRRSFREDPPTRDFALARVAWFSGDLSQAARLWSIAARQPSRFSSPGQASLHDVLHALGLEGPVPPREPRPSLGFVRYGTRMWTREAPSAAQWQRQNRSRSAALVYHNENIVAAKHMLVAGRAAELAATYDSPSALLGIVRGQSTSSCQLHETALVALALRGAGREREAGALLDQAARLIREVYRRGAADNDFEEDAAAIFAAQGRADAAIDALLRAQRGGWLHVGATDLADLRDEPAFRALRDLPRFKAAVDQLDARMAAERRETSAALRRA